MDLIVGYILLLVLAFSLAVGLYFGLRSIKLI